MTRTIVHSPESAAVLVRDGATVLITGSGGGLMDADYIYEALERRFLETGHPKDLTLVHVTGIGNRNERGISRFAHKGMVRRVIGGHWGWSPRMIDMANSGEIEAYNLPQGILSLLTREIAGGRPGLFTKVGIGTFVDPRQTGGCLNDTTPNNLVRIHEIDGEEYLFFPRFPIDVLIMRGSVADTRGNISSEFEAADLDVLSAAQAASASNGIVLAQVKNIAEAGQLHPRMVAVPGALVDAVVVNPDQWQTVEGENNPGYSGTYRVPTGDLPEIEHDLRRVVARRAALELRPGQRVNLGFGIADGVANVAAQEAFLSEITFFIEQGLVGGAPAKGDIFGASLNPDAIITAPSQFDFFHGGGLDITFLGMAQVDKDGNVNVSKFGSSIPGCGGFIDISQNARKVVFCGSFTAGGLAVEFTKSGLTIKSEGRHHKFIDKVEHITFNGPLAIERGQEVFFVTERAVFKLEADGLVLIEVADGIDLETDIVGQMGFTPGITDNLRRITPTVFSRNRLGLASMKEE